jgi:hypothetical protein
VRFFAYYVGIKRAETIQPRLNALRVRLFFENLTGPRRSEPGALVVRGADLRKSASALAAARNLPKLWRVGLVPRPTLHLGQRARTATRPARQSFKPRRRLLARFSPGIF